MILELITNILILIGTVFALITAIGLYKLPGIYLKMHAATKAGTLGSGLVLLGVGIQIGKLSSITEALLLILFIAVTNPISAHLIAKTTAIKHHNI